MQLHVSYTYTVVGYTCVWEMGMYVPTAAARGYMFFFSAFLQEREGSGTGVLSFDKIARYVLVEVLSNIYKLAHCQYLSTS